MAWGGGDGCRRRKVLENALKVLGMTARLTSHEEEVRARWRVPPGVDPDGVQAFGIGREQALYPHVHFGGHAGFARSVRVLAEEGLTAYKDHFLNAEEVTGARIA